LHFVGDDLGHDGNLSGRLVVDTPVMPHRIKLRRDDLSEDHFGDMAVMVVGGWELGVMLHDTWLKCVMVSDDNTVLPECHLLLAHPVTYRGDFFRKGVYPFGSPPHGKKFRRSYAAGDSLER